MSHRIDCPLALRSTALVLTVSLLGGCATVLSEDYQELSVKLSCKDRQVMASCTAENDRGSWRFSAPGNVTVKNSTGSLSITCKPQYMERFTVSTMALPSLSMAANALLGGVIGAAVDVYSNTGFKYPDNIDISSNSCK